MKKTRSDRLTITSPATLLEMAEIAGVCTPLQWDVFRELHRRGDTFVGRVAGELAVVCGLYPIEGTDSWEVWFRFLPPARNHMLQVLRAIRLTIHSGNYRCILCICETVAGRRIARAAGLEYAEDCNLGEIWTCRTYSEAKTTKRNALQSRKPKRDNAAASRT